MARTTSKMPKAPEAANESEKPANLPVFTYRHRSLKAAVWKNASEAGPFYNVTVTRSFKEGETWRESASFGYDDILVVAELLRTCHGFITREIAKQSIQAKE